MHKKLFTAVLALGMLLYTVPDVLATAKQTPQGEPPVLTVGSSNSMPTARPTFEANPDPLVSIAAGASRTAPGTFCDGQWQAPFGFTVGGWYGQFAGQFYAAYQDPSDPTWWGGPACNNSPSFDVTAINLIARYSVAPFPSTFSFQPLVITTDPGFVDYDPFYDPMSATSGLCADGLSYTANCSVGPAPIPGSIHCAGPLYSVTWTAAASFALNLPFPLECCVEGPYFAAYYAPTPGGLRLGCDNGSLDTDTLSVCAGGTVSEPECGWFMDFGAGWFEMGKVFEFNFGSGDPLDPPYDNAVTLNHILYSEGYSVDDPATHCTPGICDYQWWYEGDAADCVNDNPGERQNDCWFANHPIPDFLEVGLNGERPEMWVRFTAAGLDTLRGIDILMGAFAMDIDMSVRITVYEAGGVSPVCGKPVPGAVRGFVDFPGELSSGGGVITRTYDLSSIPVADRVFGTLNGGPIEHFFVGVSLSPGVDPNNNALAPAFGDVIQDFTDNPICVADPHSGAFFTDYMNGGGPQHRYLGEFEIIRGGVERYRHGEIWMDALMCTEQLPAIEVDCGAGSDDEWTSFAHDNQQTSASSINVIDPNQVTLTWTSAFTRVATFTSPTVANDIVYWSTDQRVDAFALATGALVGSLAGTPEMGSANRGNTTIAFTRGVAGGDRDVVFATGGNFNAISALETNLETSPTIWSNNTSTMPPLGLGQQNRFNTSRVVDVAGTDVLFLCTEPASGTGLIFAFNAATGALYPGWVTNPVVLDAAAKHGPAVSGGKLYVGTANGGSDVNGSLYQIDAATGAIDWTFVGTNDATEGWPGGVSTEGDFLYGATKDANGVGVRYKIDKSGLAPSVVWSAVQGNGSYGTPTIGRNFVYFPLDAPSVGILQINKDLGLVARNFAASDICGTAIGSVPLPATLSCDAYLFAGDVNGRWWLFNAEDGAAEWYRGFPVFNGGETVSGTALASHSSGTDYAVVGVRQLGGLGAQLSVYQLNAGPRPRLIQCVTDVQIPVPLNSGPGQPHSEPGALLNIGDLPLTFSAYSVSDPPGLASVGRETREMNRRLAAAANEYDGYSTYATADNLSKSQRVAGLTAERDEETGLNLTRARRIALIERDIDRYSSRTSMAASAAAIRTSGVTINGSGFPYVLAAAGTGDLDWLFDGTGLGRGVDNNVLELTNNDPDFTYDAVNNGGISVAEVNIMYVGGCLRAEDTLHFGAGNSEHVFNYGALGFQARVDAFYFANDPNDPETNIYDSGLMLLGDSLPAPNGGAQVRTQIYRNSGGDFGHYVANPAPASQVCGFDVFRDVVLGAKRDGGCPGTPVAILGEIITHHMSDTDQTAIPGTRLAAIGMDIQQTEVGAYDPLYGDFKLIEWEVTNRDAVAKGPIYIGTWTDWDVVPAYATNVGNFSAAAGGYYIYDVAFAGPKNAYGQLDPAQASTYSGTSLINPPYRIVVHHNNNRQAAIWPMQDLEGVWSESVHETPLYGVDVPATQSDKAGLLINAAMNFGPNGVERRYQAYFGVDATGGVDAAIAANVQALAKRAARWGGFARGDVNDDGLVDLADVCWLQGGNPIYPAAYSGDVDADGDNDAADVTRLLSYVSGNAGDQPAGAWRF